MGFEGLTERFNIEMFENWIIWRFDFRFCATRGHIKAWGLKIILLVFKPNFGKAMKGFIYRSYVHKLMSW